MMSRPAPVPVAGGGRRRVPAALSRLAAGLIRGKALDNPVAGKHASIHGEVPADHEGTHGSVLLSQGPGLIG